MTKGALHHYFNAHSLLEVDRIDRTLKEPVIYKTMKPIEDMWLGYLNEQYPILKKQFTEEQIPFLLGLGEPLGKGEGRELVLHDGKIILKKDIEIMVKV